jgi:hypothetical protein
MCNLNNIIESEKHLEEYSNYMDFIFKHIVSENKDKYKRLIKEEDIELGHIHKYEGKGFEGAERWFFNYKIITRGYGYDLHRTTNQIGFNEWKRLLIKENRDKRIEELLSGLDKPEKEKIGL